VRAVRAVRKGERGSRAVRGRIPEKILFADVRIYSTSQGRGLSIRQEKWN
jgi:hypothetical protein